jgi:hypothetical protein
MIVAVSVGISVAVSVGMKVAVAVGVDVGAMQATGALRMCGYSTLHH